MYNPFNVERHAAYLSGFSDVRTDAYDWSAPATDNLPQISVGGAIKNIALGGMAWSAARSAWYGSRAMGINYSLGIFSGGDVFGDKAMTSRFKAKTLTGPLRSLFDAGASLITGKPTDLLRNSPELLDAYKSAGSMGWLERYVLQPDELKSKLIKEGISKANVDDVMKSFRTSLHAPFDSSKVTGSMAKQFKDIRSKRKLGITDIILGTKGEGGSYGDRVKDTIIGERGVLSTAPGSKHFKALPTYGHAQKAYTRMAVARDAIGVHLKSTPADTVSNIVSRTNLRRSASALGSDSIANHLYDASVRKSRIRFAGLAVGGIVAGVATAEVAKLGAVKFAEVTQRLTATMKSMRTLNFGKDVIMSDRMSTERQRAISEIQNASMNARYLMGSEATMYH